MTRLLSFVLVCATAAIAPAQSETSTYVDGNLTGVSPNTGGTLVFSDAKTLSFRTGLATVSVPYSAITRAELGATRETSHDVALYKFWARHKKTETQFLKVDFKNEEGEAKTMTLELAQPSAASALATIQDHTGTQVARTTLAQSAAAPILASANKPIIDPHDKGDIASPPTKPGSAWWGDDVWKTDRNAGGWTKPTGAIAPQE